MRRWVQDFRKWILMGWLPFLMAGTFVSNAHAQWVSIVPPEVSPAWGLNKGRILTSKGWAVGTDVANKRGVLLQFSNNAWTVIDPPNVSSNWGLNAVGLSAGNDVWAVGVDYSTGSRSGVILRYLNKVWSIFPAPFVSLDWELVNVSFSGSAEGWAVGVDYSNQRGVLLHYKLGTWTSLVPPDVSLDWGLNGIHMVNASDGWAVGRDRTNQRGVLLRFSKDLDDKNRQKRLIWQVYLPPQINGDWELTSVFSPSITEGWAAGVNHTEKRGVMLHYLTPRWDEVIPPSISEDWEFDTVNIPSTYNGWVSGTDYVNKKGILLQYEKGVWTDSTLPEISSNWGLGSIRFTATDQIWAFGTDFANKKGVILRYSANTKETISAPSKPNGPTPIASKAVSTFFTGESLSNLDHSIQYFFDWGDGTDSGWLPVGTVGASKSWTTPGTYQVKAQARCDTDTSVVSKWSSELTVTVSDTPSTITLLSPPDGTPYTGCSIYSLPTFAWNANGSFTSYEIQFSRKESFDTVTTSDKTSSTSILMDDVQWKKVILANGSTSPGSFNPGASGGPMFWRVVGTGADKTSVISDTLSVFIDPVQAVGNPIITDTSKSSIPVLSWENNCNIKFKVWFGNNPYFSHKTSITFNIKDPDENGGITTKTLTSSQWTAVQNVTGRITGSTVYWYVESWDKVNRQTITQPNGVFVITD